jgi:3',5'-cyclic AMP phosphodiesterase CpdA
LDLSHQRLLKSRLDRAKRSCVAAIAVLACALALVSRGFGQQENNFRFAILGDRTGDADPAVYVQIWDEIDREHPDFVMNVGDSIQGGNDATAESEWRELRRLWDRHPYPLYFTPGNHDIWSAASRRIYAKETGQAPPYSFNHQSAHFSILDNSDSLNLSDQQMQFLEHDLEQNKDRNPKFVFFHKPFWLIPLKLQSGDFPFHRLVKKYGVGFVVSGHGHQFVSMTRDGIDYLEAGSSGGRLKSKGFEKGWFYQHAIVRVNGSRVDVIVKEIGPPFGQGRSFRPDGSGQGAKPGSESPVLQR